MKPRSRFLIFAVLLVFTLSALVGCGPAKKAAAPNQTAEKMKVGFIYIGTPGDAGFTYAHDQGRKFLEKELPWVETIVSEKVADVDAERVASELAEKGCKVIFATSFGEMDGVMAAAKKYPDVVFMHCSGYKTEKNAGTYFGRIYQSRYLTGLVAGKMTKTNKIGYVAAYPIPEVVRGINAFTRGVREVNPKAAVKVVWTNTWYDPTKEKQAAKSLLDDGCDLIAQHQDTYAPQQAAEEAGKYAIGYNSDMHAFAPKANLTSAVWNWGPFYVKTVKQVKEGTWKNDQYWGRMADNIVGIAPMSDLVPADVQALVKAKQQDIIANKFDVFDGPVKDQSGKVRIPAGQTMSDPDMLGFNWFVEGVEGSIK
ncbi:MAG: BMP family ABC transporter substrate-binding protein [Solirubrobacterales bacterium]